MSERRAPCPREQRRTDRRAFRENRDSAWISQCGSASSIYIEATRTAPVAPRFKVVATWVVRLRGVQLPSLVDTRFSGNHSSMPGILSEGRGRSCIASSGNPDRLGRGEGTRRRPTAPVGFLQGSKAGCAPPRGRVMSSSWRRAGRSDRPCGPPSSLVRLGPPQALRCSPRRGDREARGGASCELLRSWGPGCAPRIGGGGWGTLDGRPHCGCSRGHGDSR